jgi:uncharacterized repeat protein (TIGR03803 family)
MTPTSDGKWTYKVIHQFTGGKGGSDPVLGLALDESGTLYGVAAFGGQFGGGAFYKLTPGIGDKWTYRVLHHFNGAKDGADSQGLLARDAAGNFYGSTALDGVYGRGTIFKIAPNPDGTWKFSVLYSFGTEADYVLPGVIVDTTGNVYGISVGGGTYGAGMVFEITP